MVKKVADTLIETEYTHVRADIPDYKKPSRIDWIDDKKGHVPDVTGFKNYQIVIEIETDDSIEDKQTENRWVLFSFYCSQKKADFLIVVPRGSKNKAENRIKKLDIKGEVLEISI